MDLLREKFAESGWTKAGLGRKVGISGWYVSSILSGLENPAPETLAKLIAVLKEVIEARHTPQQPRWSDLSPSRTIRDMAMTHWRGIDELPPKKTYPRGIVEAITQMTGCEGFQVYRWLKNPDRTGLEWNDLRRVAAFMGVELECVCRVGRNLEEPDLAMPGLAPA